MGIMGIQGAFNYREERRDPDWNHVLDFVPSGGTTDAYRTWLLKSGMVTRRSQGFWRQRLLGKQMC